MRNFSDHGDVGEVWFGEDSEMRIIRFAIEYFGILDGYEMRASKIKANFQKYFLIHFNVQLHLSM